MSEQVRKPTTKMLDEMFQIKNRLRGWRYKYDNDDPLSGVTRLTSGEIEECRDLEERITAFAYRVQERKTLIGGRNE